MRHFYTDPLAAAWMAKHFGTRFVSCNGAGPYGFEDIVTDYSDEDGAFREPYTSRWYIHPDSVPLLEPMMGDGIAVNHERGGCPDFDKIKYVELHGFINIEGGPDLNRGQYKIIQRNGLAFMWPESEAA